MRPVSDWSGWGVCGGCREAVLLVCEETREIMTEELQDVFKDRRGLGDDSSSDDSDDR